MKASAARCEFAQALARLGRRRRKHLRRNQLAGFAHDDRAVRPHRLGCMMQRCSPRQRAAHVGLAPGANDRACLAAAVTR